MIAPPHTVIYTHGGGRLGNQVVRFLHWMAWTRAHPGRVEVLNHAFWPYADYFSRWREHPGCLFPVRPGRADRLARRWSALPRRLHTFGEARHRLARVVHATGRWRPGWQALALDVPQGEKFDLEDPGFLALVARRTVTTCSGWNIAGWRLVAEQQAELREYFRPAPEFAYRAAEFMAELRRGHDVVIGLFIRQSDYKVWHDGRFYFPTGQYAAWIRQLLDLHGGRRVAIVVASEERQDPAHFAGLPVFFATGTPNAGGVWFESWAELALCDFVVSPPSTFAATAAFLGGVPLWPLAAAGQVLAFDQLISDGLIGAARHPVFSLAVK